MCELELNKERAKHRFQKFPPSSLWKFRINVLHYPLIKLGTHAFKPIKCQHDKKCNKVSCPSLTRHSLRQN